MKGFSYRERDYIFGQTMQNFRATFGLTQVGLAEHLGVSRKAVGEWETGLTYPKAERLKALIILGIEHQAFPVGREEEAIRDFWQAAHQKVPLDETWLSSLLSHREVSPTSQLAEENGNPAQALAITVDRPRVDWSDALTVAIFYGRRWELTLLTSWVVEERCRVVSVLGLGGIGKSALAVRLMHQVAERFEVVIWRSLRDAPACEALLDECLKVLVPHALRDVPVSLERRLSLLMECLRRTRILLVLDNLEVLLEEGQDTGHMRSEYEGYAQLLHRMSETKHQSCLLLTSREKPADLVSLEGSRAPVRALRLARLDLDSCEHLLAEKEITGTSHEQVRLIEAYAGNPLALNIVAQTIVELFDGEIAPFLEQGEVIFGGIRELLAQQFTRLSVVEQSVLLWLAIVREPVSIEQLLALLGTPLPRAQVLEAIEALRRRSLIERGQRPGSFTLQSVVLEYATARLIEEMSNEIKHGQLARMIEHGLELATVKEYVRQTQQRLLVEPLLVQVRTVYSGGVALEGELLAQLDGLRTWADYAQGYGPANLLALLREQLGHLRRLDLSRLSIRGASLQGVEMQDTTLAEATLRETVLNEAFDIPWAVAISFNGQYWAAGSRRGEVRVWREEGRLLHLVWQAQSDTVRALAFSPDGRMLATGSWDGSIKLWDIESGAPLWTCWFTDNIESLAFAPDGRTLACGGDDATVQIWDAISGAHRQTLSGQGGPVFALAWSPDGSLLASCGFDQTIWLWDVDQSSYGTGLHGHTAGVYDIAFTPDNLSLLSGSEDGTLRVWDVERGHCIHIMQGYAVSLFDVAWSPDGTQLASAGSNTLVTIWDVEGLMPPRLLRGHRSLVFGVAWSPDGTQLAGASYYQGVYVWEVSTGTRRWVGHEQSTRIRRVAWSPDGNRLASSGDDGSIFLWDTSDGRMSASLQGHRGMVMSVVWSPDGTRLASGGGGRGRGEVFVWDAHSGERLYALSELSGFTCALAWDPGGAILVSGGGDGALRWWDVQRGEYLRVCEAHQGTVESLKVSPDGNKLASCGDDGAIMLWDLHTGEHLRALRRDRPYERLDISGVKGLTEAQKATLRALGAIERVPGFPLHTKSR